MNREQYNFLSLDAKPFRCKLPAIQKSSAISVFDRKLHILILLTELIPNITFLFEFEQVFEEKFSKYGEHKKNRKIYIIVRKLEISTPSTRFKFLKSTYSDSPSKTESNHVLLSHKKQKLSVAQSVQE
jgi:hypothetical protein